MTTSHTAPTEPTEHGHQPAVTVKVNTKDVHFSERRVTGAEIKATAIQQHVPIEQNFSLFENKGSQLEPIGDDDQVQLHPSQEFTAVAPDDNS